jgi:hypothetical protein
MEVVGFELTGIWNGGSRFWTDRDILKWKKSLLTVWNVL